MRKSARPLAVTRRLLRFGSNRLGLNDKSGLPYTAQKWGAHMRFTGLLMALVCAAALFVPAQEDAERVIQSKIVALEKAWNQAYKLGDKRALDRILDDQIVLINDDGSQQTKAAFLASVKTSNPQRAASRTRIDERQCVRQYRYLHRSISGQWRRSRKALRSP